MRLIKIFASLLIISVTLPFSLKASPDPDFHIYLCIGQSNMEGNALIEDMDCEEVSDRFLVMAATDFNNPERTKGDWYVAYPPIVRQQTGLTPIDYFGRTMVINLPEKVKVGVIAVAIGGCKIEHLDKDFDPSSLDKEPEWFQNFISAYDNRPYARLIECARKAQETGVIKGILLHQGESNNGDEEWCVKVNKIYNDILTDLGLRADDVPLIAGEVVSTSQGGICGSMNDIISKLPKIIANSYVVSSENLTQKGDGLHFTAASYRELGRRYAVKMLSFMGISVKETSYNP